MPLHVAAFNHHEGAVRLLLEAGAAVDPQDIDGGTPLHYAVSDVQLPIVEALLRAGADPAIETDAGDTAYDLAARVDSPEITRLLEQFGDRTSASVGE